MLNYQRVIGIAFGFPPKPDFRDWSEKRMKHPGFFDWTQANYREKPRAFTDPNMNQL
jgi:hypothetical protein